MIELTEIGTEGRKVFVSIRHIVFVVARTWQGQDVADVLLSDGTTIHVAQSAATICDAVNARGSKSP